MSKRMNKNDIRNKSDWQKIPFGQIADFRNGINFLRKDFGHTVKIVGVSDFQDRYVCDLSNLETVSISKPSNNEDMVREGDLLFVRSNGNKNLIGRCLLVPKISEPISHSGFTIRARIKNDSVIPEYVNLQMRTSLIRNQIFTEGGGTNISNLSQEILQRLLIPLPSKSEQKAIVDVLRVWDELALNLRKLIGCKIKTKQGLMQQLLTGKRRFPGCKGEWKKIRLGKLFLERDEINRPDLPLLSITSEKGIIPHSEMGRKDSSNEDKSLYKRIAVGDIGYNTMRMWQGVSALSPLEGLVSPAYTICIPGPDAYGPFIAQLFKYPEVVHQFYRHSQGLVSDTLNLKFCNFAEIQVNVPDVFEQKKIASFFESVDNEIQKLNEYLQVLQIQKKGLMQKLLTGKIRVKT